MIERKRVHRKKGATAPTKDEEKSSSPGGVAGQLLRLQASGGNQATVALLSRSTDVQRKRKKGADEEKESESEDADAGELFADLEEEQAESEGEDEKADVQELVAEQAAPGPEEAKSGDAGEVAEILALAEELEQKESEGEDADLDDASGVEPEKLVQVEDQIVEELESPEVDGEEAKELESALTKVRKLKVLAMARVASRGAESESKDAESEG